MHPSAVVTSLTQLDSFKKVHLWCNTQTVVATVCHLVHLEADDSSTA